MCGIVGLVSRDDVFSEAVTALGRLEYRGYDSYGFAYRRNDCVETVKAVGAIGEAVGSETLSNITSVQVISHTRWATHGGVTKANAHPHSSFDGRVIIVHNGVIENYRKLRTKLAENGIECISQTDSEVIAHLIALELNNGCDMLTAIDRTLPQLHGEYALGILDALDPNVIFGARYKGPLLVATRGELGILASDPIALTGCSSLTHLEDGDVVRIEPGRFDIFSKVEGGTREVKSRPSTFNENRGPAASKGGYDHYMIKEINEIPAAIRTIAAMPADHFTVLPPAITARTAFVGSGSAYFVGMIGQYLFAELAGDAVSVVPADEAANLLRLRADDWLVAISQSGETFDTLEAVRLVEHQGVRILSICNVPGCSLERAATKCIQQGSGTEICVLSTKSIMSQVAILMRLALERGAASGWIQKDVYVAHSKALERLPDRLEQFIDGMSDRLSKLAIEIADITDWFFIGRGILYPAALEAALKFKEVSYHHAEGMSAGFLKHGTISLIRPDFFSVALLPSKGHDSQGYNAVLSAVSEIVARNGPVIGIGPSDADPDDLIQFKHYVPIDYTGDGITDIFFQLLAGQLLAYHCALKLGRNIDRPRGLAKSVTVR